MQNDFKVFMISLVEEVYVSPEAKAVATNALDGLYAAKLLREGMPVEVGIECLQEVSDRIALLATRARVAMRVTKVGTNGS